VNAALAVSGVTVTVGHAFEPCRCTRFVCSLSIIGKKIASSFFFRFFANSRLCTWAIATFAGKHGSIAPRPDPSRYRSPLVKSE
jgi:hypothetical protein